nr:MAG TPA: hypothetical protein [Caudoviricetes sp.]
MSLNNLVYIGKFIANADNVFSVMGLQYEIDQTVPEYKVYQSYKEVDDYTNASDMSAVFVFIEKGTNQLKFYDEHHKEINKLNLLSECMDMEDF